MRAIANQMLRLSVITLVAGAIAGGAIACGGGKKSPMAVKPEQTKSVMPADPRQEIEQLEADIAAARAQLELAEPGEQDFPGVEPVPMGKVPALQDPLCKPAKTEKCTTSCTLSDSICTNADKICKLAGDIGDDPARGKCIKANKTCEASRTKCCGCQ